jgi:hypothetical protein
LISGGIPDVFCEKHGADIATASTSAKKRNRRVMGTPVSGHEMRIGKGNGSQAIAIV